MAEMTYNKIHTVQLSRLMAFNKTRIHLSQDGEHLRDHWKFLASLYNLSAQCPTPINPVPICLCGLVFLF